MGGIDPPPSHEEVRLVSVCERGTP
jgi:hypothetical protein